MLNFFDRTWNDGLAQGERNETFFTATIADFDAVDNGTDGVGGALGSVRAVNGTGPTRGHFGNSKRKKKLLSGQVWES